jgi:endonuclease G
MGGYGVNKPLEHQVQFNPRCFFTSPAEEFDYTLVQLQETPLADKMIPAGIGERSMLDLLRQDKHRGYLVAMSSNIRNLTRVNIIQHPSGRELKVVLTHNLVANDATDTRVQYYADTKPGSSGSPVFNNLWVVVALHHSYGHYPPDSNFQSTAGNGKDIRYAFNEGIPMKAILADFKSRETDTGSPLISLIPEAR